MLLKTINGCSTTGFEWWHKKKSQELNPFNPKGCGLNYTTGSQIFSTNGYLVCKCWENSPRNCRTFFLQGRKHMVVYEQIESRMSLLHKTQVPLKIKPNLSPLCVNKKNKKNLGLVFFDATCSAKWCQTMITKFYAWDAKLGLQSFVWHMIG